MTVRNVRAHQTRGLLPPPELEGRTGFYSSDHLARLNLIKDMQAAGFNLGAIKSLLASAPQGAGEELLRLERALLVPWSNEIPQEFTIAELAELFGGQDPKILGLVVDLGLLTPVGTERYLCNMPTLLRAGRQLGELGISAENMVDVLESLLEHVRGISQGFVKLFLEGVWRPFDGAGRPAEDWPRVRQALEKLRPLALEAVTSAFGTLMSAAVDEAFGREVDHLSKPEEAV